MLRQFLMPFALAVGLIAAAAQSDAKAEDADARAVLVSAEALDDGLFGERLGVVAGSPAEQALKRWLGDASDVIDVVVLDAADPSTLDAAFKSGRIDSFYADPATLRALKARLDGRYAVFTPPAPLTDAYAALTR